MGSSEFFNDAGFGVSPFRSSGPTRLKPTTSTPPVFTNCRRESVAPKTFAGFSLMVAIAYLPFAMIVAACCTASMIAT